MIFPEKSVFILLLSYFCTLFSKKLAFCYSTTFFKSLITHKRFVFKESYISYGKRQKSCTLIVIWVKCLYLTSPTFNSSAKSNRLFLLQRRKYFNQNRLNFDVSKVRRHKISSQNCTKLKIDLQNNTHIWCRIMMKKF